MRQRIRDLRKAAGLTIEQLAEKAGVHYTTMSKIERGVQAIDTDWLNKLAGILGVRPAELLEDSPVGVITVRGRAQAGHWVEAVEWSEDDRYTIAVPPDIRFKNVQRFAVEIQGDSMDRVMPEGSIAVVVRSEDILANPVAGAAYLVHRVSSDGLHEATVKYLEKDPEGAFWLVPKSSNPRHVPLKIGATDDELVELVGRVESVVQRL